jgi:drug/metabolite transporter (DMT)-like permease
MLWLLLALVTAFFFASHQVLSKKLLTNTNNALVAWASYIFGLPLILILAYFFLEIKYDETFLIAFAATIIFNLGALLLFFKSIQISPLSKVVPLLNLTPLFIVVSAVFIAGEFPGPQGVIGISVIVLGAYLLNVSSFHAGLLEPIKFIFKDKGSFFMIIVALLWALSASFDKLALNHSTPSFFVFCEYLVYSLILIPIALKSKNSVQTLKTNYKTFILLGLAFAIMIITQMHAISLHYVSYVIAIKRAGILFSVLIGWLYFKETNIKESLLGTIVMIIGVFILAI